ncbi:MAG: asparagine synthase-related protein [Thermodesulfobacteriota bacterium]|nr:asparagine synthase-related protein [Thermodesulfobacteriota bacterium]
MELNGVYIWLDGEFYNQRELARRTNGAVSDPEILLNLYKTHPDFSFLKNIDGIYSAIIYDKIQQSVHLITDRYGLKHLYWCHRNNSLAWASEVKAFLCLPWLTLTIDEQSLSDFFRVGYLLENETWFNEVKLLPSGTVLSYQIKSKNKKQLRYWWWDNIIPLQQDLDEGDLVEELGRLFNEAVANRCKKGERVGLTLSGGLDSRAILAAMPEGTEPIHAITFGKKGCEDIRIAAVAAEVKGAEHHVCHINESNWLAPRIEGVWWTDGQLNMLHMHGIEGLEGGKKYMDITLNGFAGDVILGGSFLKNRRCCDTVTKCYAGQVMKVTEECLHNFQEYKQLRKPDYYFLQNRIRRFVHCGSKAAETHVHNPKPFYDNKLIEFIYSLPDRLRLNSHLYTKMLVGVFPDYFSSIPWQATGYPISRDPRRVAMLLGIRKIRRRVSYLLTKGSSDKLHGSSNYTDYYRWIRSEPASSYFRQVLLSRDAIYGEYIPRERVVADLDGHLRGSADHSDMLCRYLTFEIWLQQVFMERQKMWKGSKAT